MIAIVMKKANEFNALHEPVGLLFFLRGCGQVLSSAFWALSAEGSNPSSSTEKPPRP